MDLIALSNNRQRHHLPTICDDRALSQTNEVIRVQPLHDDDDRGVLVVPTWVYGIVERLVRLAPGRFGIISLERIVYDDQVGSASRDSACDRCRAPAPPAVRFEFLNPPVDPATAAF